MDSSTTPSALSRPHAMKSEWDQLVEALAQSHTRVASGLQLAFEKQWGSTFSAALQAYAVAKEGEIRGVCSANHQEFVDSIEEIVRMKTDVAALHRDIENFQTQIAGATAGVLTGYDQLDGCYRVQQCIDDSIAKLRQCQRIVGLVTTVEQNIANAQLFHALRVLDELREELAHYRGHSFPQRLHDWMLVAQQTIKDEAKRAVSTWLETMRDTAMAIGTLAIQRFRNQHDDTLEDQELRDKCLAISTSPPAVTDEIMKLPSLNVLSTDASVLRDKSASHAEYTTKMLEKIAPMLRVIHVFRVMNQVPELVAFYNTNRVPQLQIPAFLTGDAASMTPERFVAQQDELFRKLTGAFCVEHLLWRHSDEALLARKEINGIFHMLLQSLCGVVTAAILRVEIPSTILDIKRSAVMCARTLGDEIHEYNPSAIFDTFRKLAAHFRHCLLTHTIKHVTDLMATDTFANTRVTKAELPEVLRVVGVQGQEATMLQHVDLNAETIVLPFTEVVLQSCRAIAQLIDMMFEFERFLNINDWGDAVRDDTIEALGALNGVLNAFIDERSDLQVSMVVAVGTNASYLAQASAMFDRLVKLQTEAWEARTYGASVTTFTRANLANKPHSSPRLASKVGATNKFETTTTRAQDMVCELMLKKIDELLSGLYLLDWTPREVSLQPDPAMWDLINYLHVTFAQLAPLPQVARDAVHFAACIHIAKSIEQLLAGPHLKKLTMAGVSNAKRNLDALRDGITSAGIPQLKECFAGVTLLCELFLCGDADKYVEQQAHDAGMLAKYSSLSMDTVAAMHEKVKAGKGVKKSLIQSVVKGIRK